MGVTVNAGLAERILKTCNQKKKHINTYLWDIFHLSKLAGQTGQSVNRMRHFELILLQNLKKHSENGTPYFEEIQRTGPKRFPQIGTFRLRMTFWPASSDKWKAPYVQKLSSPAKCLAPPSHVVNVREPQ